MKSGFVIQYKTNLFGVRIRDYDTKRIHGFAKRIHVFTNLLYESRILSFFFSSNKICLFSLSLLQPSVVSLARSVFLLNFFILKSKLQNSKIKPGVFGYQRHPNTNAPDKDHPCWLLVVGKKRIILND